MFTLQDIIDTLNQIEVKGRDNLDRLLGAILALEAIIQARKNEEFAKQEEMRQQEEMKASESCEVSEDG